ncbi:MAG: flagellar cap protein FliD N-terminal domain-containing protein [Planctomycetota bacterium]
MSGPIQFGGLASGRDTGAIIDALVQAESVPINLLKQQKADAQNQISLLGTFQGYVDALKTKMASFAGDPFLANSVEVPSQGGLLPGRRERRRPDWCYTLEVNWLASSDRFALSSSAKITPTRRPRRRHGLRLRRPVLRRRAHQARRRRTTSPPPSRTRRTARSRPVSSTRARRARRTTSS